MSLHNLQTWIRFDFEIFLDSATYTNDYDPLNSSTPECV